MKTLRLISLISSAMLLAVLAGCGQSRPAVQDVQNTEARMPVLPVPALDWRVAAVSVDRAHGTMTHSTISMLTANDQAIAHVGVGGYPDGSVLALTTWLERDDPHWFGARLPGTLVSLEVLRFTAGPDGHPVAAYMRYAGSPLREVTDNATVEARKAVILAMEPAAMP
jgi:hypothetical protein